MNHQTWAAVANRANILLMPMALAFGYLLGRMQRQRAEKAEKAEAKRLARVKQAMMAAVSQPK